jgi:hypothetical protein
MRKEDTNGMVPTNALGEPLINFYNPPSMIPIHFHNSHYTADPDLFPPPLNYNCPQCQRNHESLHAQHTHRDFATSQLTTAIHTTTNHIDIA